VKLVDLIAQADNIDTVSPQPSDPDRVLKISRQK
jgi:hypothetical protein